MNKRYFTLISLFPMSTKQNNVKQKLARVTNKLHALKTSKINFKRRKLSNQEHKRIHGSVNRTKGRSTIRKASHNESKQSHNNYDTCFIIRKSKQKKKWSLEREIDRYSFAFLFYTKMALQGMQERYIKSNISSHIYQRNTPLCRPTKDLNTNKLTYYLVL